MHRQRVERREGVLTAVDVVRVQIGDIDQQAHPGPLDELGEEGPLAHLLVGPGHQRRDVLQRERHRQRVLRDAHVLAQHVQRVAGPRHGQQVPRLQTRRAGQLPAAADEGDVLGDERRAQRLRALRERGQPLRPGPLGAPEAERDSVRDDRDTALA